MNLLIIDNYDSFTYNLYHLVQVASPIDTSIEVHQNNKIDLKKISEFDKIILSPGPGLPKDAGITNEVICEFHQSKSIFGVCLGFQAIGEFFGVKLKNLDNVFHGVSTEITINESSGLFSGLPKKILVGRYHSWAWDTTCIPEEIQITSTSDDGNIMSARHKYFDVSGVQFHPESILSHFGREILYNWVNTNSG
ncbi:MAG: anthranilate synthase component II [Bacteroidota bacterium]|jgi:anthranilate synthase component 2